MNDLDVWSDTLRAFVPLAVHEAKEQALAEGCGFACAIKGYGPTAVVVNAVFTGVRVSSPAFHLCAGLAGAICVMQPDGTAEWSWVRERLDEATPHRPYALDLGTRPTQRPAAN